VTIQAQRGSDDSLLYEPIELNGSKYAIKKEHFRQAFVAPAGGA
jgi:hypothetical protein